MIKQIGIRDLKVGMYVVKLGVSWLRHPFARNRFLITSEYEIEKIAECGILNITIDTEKGIDVSPLEVEEEKPDKILSLPQEDETDQIKEKSVPFTKEAARADRIYKEILSVVRKVIYDIKKGNKIDASCVNSSVDQLVESVFRNHYTAVTLARLKRYDEYTFTHSINVSIFSIALGRQIGYPRQKIKTLGAGAMLHDIGKILIPEEIIKKPVSLSEDEFAIMMRHPELGIKQLKDRKNVPEGIVECIIHHHERLDGTGYPHRLKGAELTDYARIVSIADFYDATTNDRPYRKAAEPHNALKVMFALGGKYFDTAFVERFIQVVGIFPVGTLVELNTNEIGVVTAINPSELLCPDIMLITNRRSERLPLTRPIRLRDEQENLAGMRRKITGVASDDRSRYSLPDGNDLATNLLGL